MSAIHPHHHAIGVFVDRGALESALHKLKQAEFPMNKVSVVAKQADPQDSNIQSENKFERHETIQELEHGGIDGGVLGEMTGILIGLTTLFVPGVGAIAVLGAKAVIVGALVGTYYGGVAGMILGAAFGQGTSDKQAHFYNEQLAQGHYLLVVEGSEAELKQAESLLKDQGVQNWIEHRAL